jgi:hypothetical protein
LIETTEADPEMLEAEISADLETAVDESEAESDAELTEEAISEEK